MIIPVSTDAPIYHYPKATLGVIAANVAVHLAWSYLPPEAAEPYAMKLGSGLHPVQWLTHNFLHADFLHLFFNMVFLWAYGIIVEGKIGWWPFLLCYLGIGTAHGAAIQAAYLHASEPSYVLGASAVVFGLLAVSMIWAPVNDLSCFYLFFIGLRVITNTFELPIYVFAMLQLGLEGVSALLMFRIHGDPMSSGLLHISGAFWGLMVGIVLLKAGWVDCEGWDVFSILKKRQALRKAWKLRGDRLDRSKENQKPVKATRPEEDRPGLTSEERAAKLLAKVHRSLAADDIAAVQAAYEKWIAAIGDRAPRDTLMGLIKAMHEREEWAASVPPMRTLCKHYPEKSERVRLKLAAILLHNLERPTEAQRHLEQIREENLDAPLLALRRKLLHEARRMIDDGVLELEEG